MLLSNEYTLINQIKFNLIFDNDVKKLIVVKTNDIVDISYTVSGGKERIRGRVAKIMCNFNSSLGRIENGVTMAIDGSDQYCGLVVHVKPDQVLDLCVIKTSNDIYNAVCGVDNDDQKVMLVRVNEAGVFQYSIDGIKWKDAGQGPQGLSAYECAVALGFVGSEDEWLKSLKASVDDVCKTSELICYTKNASNIPDESSLIDLEKGKKISDYKFLELIVRGNDIVYGSVLIPTVSFKSGFVWMTSIFDIGSIKGWIKYATDTSVYIGGIFNETDNIVELSGIK